MRSPFVKSTEGRWRLGPLSPFFTVGIIDIVRVCLPRATDLLVANCVPRDRLTYGGSGSDG